MKTLILAGLLAACCAAAAGAEGRAGRLGGGIELGEQNGLTAKYWLGDTQAVSGGLGASDGRLSLHGEYVWHAFDLFPKTPSGALEGHLGLGGRVRSDEVGVRPLAGVGYWIEGHPIELFLDAGPVFRLSPETSTDFSAAIGVRAYLPGRR